MRRLLGNTGRNRDRRPQLQLRNWEPRDDVRMSRVRMESANPDPVVVLMSANRPKRKTYPGREHKLPYGLCHSVSHCDPRSNSVLY
jgi:hypothetical protein